MTYPKIELHVHLEGTVRPATLLEIARRNDYALPVDTHHELASLYDFRDFRHFIEIWVLTTNALQRDQDFRQVVVDYAREAASHGAVYVEGIFSPAERARRGVDWDEIFTGYCDGADEARELHGDRNPADSRHHPRLHVRGGDGDGALRRQVPRPRRARSRARRDGGGVSAGALRARIHPRSRPRTRLGAPCRRSRRASIGPRRAGGARRRPAPPRHPRGGGSGLAERDRLAPHRPRRLPDLEPPHAGGLDRWRSTRCLSSSRPAQSALSRPTIPPCSAPTSRETTRPPSRSGSTRTQIFGAGLEGALCDESCHERLRSSGMRHDWEALP